MSAIPACESRLPWSEFRSRYFAEVVPGMADGSHNQVYGAFRIFEQFKKPAALQDVTEEDLSRFIAHRRRKVCDTTIVGNLGYLLAAFRWAQRQRLLLHVPYVDIPRRGGKCQPMMKGRPITKDEFDSIVAVIPDDVSAAQWKWLLHGLWWSGLRLSEALSLRWPLRPGEVWKFGAAMTVDFSRKRTMFRVPAAAEKGYTERILPMAPEFAKMLEETPEQFRRGRVFKLPCSQFSACERISNFGRAANVIVNQERMKYASAHDFRRSFGERWAALVMPPILMQLMRHQNINTTLRYYVGKNADTTAEVLYAAWSRPS